MSDFYGGLAAVLVKGIGKFLPFTYLIFIPHTDRFIRFTADSLRIGVLYDNHAGTALCPSCIIGDLSVRDSVVSVGKTCTHRTHYKPIFNRYITNLNRRKNFSIFHPFTSQAD